MFNLFCARTRLPNVDAVYFNKLNSSSESAIELDAIGSVPLSTFVSRRIQSATHILISVPPLSGFFRVIFEPISRSLSITSHPEEMQIRCRRVTKRHQSFDSCNGVVCSAILRSIFQRVDKQMEICKWGLPSSAVWTQIDRTETWTHLHQLF